jgi:hypothetical protein
VILYSKSEAFGVSHLGHGYRFNQKGKKAGMLRVDRVGDRRC